MNRRYTIKLDSIWTPVAKYLAELPERYDQGEAYEHYTRARKATVDLLIALAPTINHLLTADQRRQAPRARRELSRHALPRGHSQRHGGRRWWRSVRWIRWRWLRWRRRWWWRLRTRTRGLTDAERSRHTHRYFNAQIDHRAVRCRAVHPRIARIVRVGAAADGRTPAAQQPPAQQPSERPPARPLGPAIATSDPMGADQRRASASRRPSARERSGAPARRDARLEHEADQGRRRHDAHDAERVRRARRRSAAVAWRLDALPRSRLAVDARARSGTATSSA